MSALRIPFVEPPMGFHDDSEVDWDGLHEPAGERISTCASCGNEQRDDRFHFLVLVTANDDKFKEAAGIYQKFLHYKRRELIGKASADALLLLFGGTRDE